MGVIKVSMKKIRQIKQEEKADQRKLQREIVVFSMRAVGLDRRGMLCGSFLAGTKRNLGLKEEVYDWMCHIKGSCYNSQIQGTQ